MRVHGVRRTNFKEHYISHRGSWEINVLSDVYELKQKLIAESKIKWRFPSTKAIGALKNWFSCLTGILTKLETDATEALKSLVLDRNTWTVIS